MRRRSAVCGIVIGLSVVAPAAHAQRHNASDVTGPMQGSGLTGNAYAPTPSGNTSTSGGTGGAVTPTATVTANAVGQALTTLSNGVLPGVANAAAPQGAASPNSALTTAAITDVTALLLGNIQADQASGGAMARLTAGLSSGGASSQSVRAVLQSLEGLSTTSPALVPARILAAIRAFNAIVETSSTDFLQHPSSVFTVLHATLSSITTAAGTQ
jgi:hypothetical protein